MNELLPLLRQASGELGLRAYLVGGYVRDSLLGRPCHDMDVVVEGPTEAALRLAVRFAELAGALAPALFPRFGTAQAKVNGCEVEFVSARAESYADDSRKPEVRPGTVEEDLLRRDFTINAILMDLEGRIVDPLGGLADLAAQTLVTPRPPVETFNDDPLRMLRAIRFAVQLGFDLAPELEPAMRAMAERARPPKLSAERVRDELVKMLLSPDPARALRLLADSGLLAVVLPELERCRGVEQNTHHLYDVFEHTVRVVAGVQPDLVLRLAAVCHDFGKPETADGKGHFHGHEYVGADMARRALVRLRFSNDQVEAIVRLVQMHMRPVTYRGHESDGAVRRLVSDAGPLLDGLMELTRADQNASAEPAGERQADLERRLAAVQVVEPARLAPLPVTGHDIMELLDLAPGPAVGHALDALRERVLDGELPPVREALLAALKASA